MSLASVPGVAAASDAFGYVGGVASLDGITVVDARARRACIRRSLRGAHCLPAADFLGPHGRLASFRQIFWLLGTAGLSGRQHVLVVGDDPTERDFVAGMLYLCGQARVSVLKAPIAEGAGLPAAQLGPGTPRAMTRNPVYQAAVRDDDLVLRSDLAREIAAGDAPPLLDGRSGAEYWGERIRAWRGGHVPGAQSLPMDSLRRELDAHRVELPKDRTFVAYGHDAFESVAYFTLLRAGSGIPARVLIDGYADWANHPDLPLASQTYPDRPPVQVAAPAAAAAPGFARWLEPLAMFNSAALLVLAGGVIYACRPRT
ncbi:MAG: rhodanese-like domain-containing protein [Casimicrobiaceae bacterium]